eukprot:gnl/MRDRNA2_/MRDRNA2_20781_c0_seq1.p1 gnl/MRDRNA2_/MRDRNA2_20781_c0~~gnl/MRDRNA2_/MRDRNA2_20781_c0_seq1.p1  ORF type:complete len:693 (+),score=91.62 gnl/MRDRNA2_/MRDRNA2_20781_c0_seq1:177-2255(+)
MIYRMHFVVLISLLASSIAAGYRFLVYTEKAFAREVAETLNCTKVGDGMEEAECGSWHDEHEVHLWIIQNATDWDRRILKARGAIERKEMVGSVFLGIGYGIVPAFKQLMWDNNHGSLKTLLEWASTLLLTVFISPSLSVDERKWCSKANKVLLTGRHQPRLSCFFFELQQGIFAAAAGAVLIPWDRNRFAVVSDRPMQDAAKDKVYEAFAHGVEYIDPALGTLRLQVDSAGPPGSTTHLRGLKSEVRRILSSCPVIYLDLHNSLSLYAALEAVQAEQEFRRGITSTLAIVPPGFEVFDDHGSPLTPWSTAILNSVGLNIGRAIEKALNLTRDVRGSLFRYSFPPIFRLTLEEDFVTTLWTRQSDEAGNSLWLNRTIGVLGQNPSISAVLEQPCGKESLVEFWWKNIIQPMNSIDSDSDDEEVCQASIQCCTPSSQAVLQEFDYLSSLQCDEEECGDGLWAKKDMHCGGGFSDTHQCAAMPYSNVTVGVRHIGIGIAVKNIADIDIARGIFYTDINIYLYEDNKLLPQESVNHGLVPRECNFMGLAHTLNLSSITNFHQLIMMAGTDKWLTFEAKETTYESFVHLKGNVFFRPDLQEWPFDVQRLGITFDSAISLPLHFCIMPEFSTVLPDIQLAGIHRDQVFELLDFEWDVQQICWPPFLTKSHNLQKVCTEFLDCLRKMSRSRTRALTTR